jgi:hypothetical protein
MSNAINSTTTVDFRNIGELVTLELGADPSARVAQYLTESAKERRDANESERSALEEQLSETERAQVSRMYEQAEHVRAAGWERGASMIASGALGIVGATSSKDSTKGSLAGGGKIVEGTGALRASTEDAEAKRCEADATAVGSAARHLERRLKELDENGADARAEQQKALDASAQAVEQAARAAQATLFIRA